MDRGGSTGIDRRAAQRGDRVPRFDALDADAGQPGGPDEREPSAESTWNDVAVSKLEPEDALHRRAALDGEGGAGLHGDVSPLAGPDGADSGDPERFGKLSFLSGAC